MGRAYDAAIFDFGGVLTTPLSLSFGSFEEALGIPEGSLVAAFRDQEPASAPAPEPAPEPDWHLLEKGLLSEDEFYARMLRRLELHTGRSLPFPDDPSAVRRKLFGGLEPNEPILDAAAAIGRHYRTAILSNNVKEWREWREMIRADVFHLVVDSSEEGVRKPDPEIYLLTCERLGVAPERAVFVDDIESNVEGARAVGMTAIHFTSNEDVLEALMASFPRAFAAADRGADRGAEQGAERA
jgi:putative hydrolase of the HAD superfamily